MIARYKMQKSCIILCFSFSNLITVVPSDIVHLCEFMCLSHARAHAELHIPTLESMWKLYVPYMCVVNTFAMVLLFVGSACQAAQLTVDHSTF